jgi:F0F1-type ATP synthase assembly protein I
MNVQKKLKRKIVMNSVAMIIPSPVVWELEAVKGGVVSILHGQSAVFIANKIGLLP